MISERFILLATHNKGKVREFQDLLAGFPVQVKSLADFPEAPEVAEDGLTFQENAVKKARAMARFSGIPALADDSGLAVEALNSAPGVYSARYAGERATDDENIEKLLLALEGVENRKASFECVLALAEPGGRIKVYAGQCRGEITRHKQGQNGFGYDPVFFYAPLHKTFAELTPDQKNQVSHRAKAIQAFKDDLPNILPWLNQPGS